jgi:DNA-binding NtrC family response regulator
MISILPDTRHSILIVDDQLTVCESLKCFFEREYRIASCTNVDEALDYLAQSRADLVLADVCLPGKTGLDLLKAIRQRGGDEAVIMMTGFATINQSVEAMRWGASDYITKPINLRDLADIIAQALQRRREILTSRVPEQSNLPGITEPQARANRPLRPSSQSNMPLVGNSLIMRKLFAMIERVAKADSSVLIVGATGTGKELVACQIHEQSKRRKRPFIDINCSAIPETLIEAELFGHERGTFTGATESRPGLFEEASGSTLFLDEVDALPLAAQAKLLRVLQERHVRRVGGRRNIPVDVRIIAATNRDLRQAINNGTFRHDLMYRLCVVPIQVPELFERREDIPLLTEFFLKRHATRRRTAPRSVKPEAMQVLLTYRWPGNVRELENAIEYALVVSENRHIGVEDLPHSARLGGRGEVTAPDLLNECVEEDASLAVVERRYIQLMLKRHRGHHIATAAALGIDRRTLSRKLQQYGWSNSGHKRVAASERPRRRATDRFGPA